MTLLGDSIHTPSVDMHGMAEGLHYCTSLLPMCIGQVLFSLGNPQLGATGLCACRNPIQVSVLRNEFDRTYPSVFGHYRRATSTKPGTYASKMLASEWIAITDCSKGREFDGIFYLQMLPSSNTTRFATVIMHSSLNSPYLNEAIRNNANLENKN